MSQRKKSKEELFLLKLYEKAVAAGDPEHEVDRYEVGKLVGEHAKGTDNTVQLLTKNNFLKRGEDMQIYLTPLGISLAKDLQQEEQ